MALARVAGAALVAAIAARARRARCDEHARGRSADALEEMRSLTMSAAAAALLVDVVARHVPAGTAAIALGLVLGVLAPCATAGVALAAGFAPHAPDLATALLATTGIVPRPAFARRARPPAAVATRSERFALLGYVLALGTLAVRGPCGLVNPRLVPLAALGAIVAFARVRRCDSGRAGARGAAAPAVMLAAIVVGSPVPAMPVVDLVAARGYPGEAVRFTGVLHANRVARFAIACCRIDAVAIELELDRRPPERDGSWIAVDGRFAERGGRLVAIPSRIRRVAAPSDPFLYL